MSDDERGVGQLGGAGLDLRDQVGLATVVVDEKPTLPWENGWLCAITSA